jgi:hypothetical protein
VGWKRKFKAPTDYCFGIKHPQIQTKNPKYIRYLCVETQRELHQWVTGIRVAKNGRALYTNYRALVDEITHADLDLLVGKRGSVNSAMCLSGGGPLPPPPHKAESCATNLNFHASPPPMSSTVSPVMTPLSENNKSFDSALSSGIRSEHFMDNLPASTFDLARFDMRVGDLTNGGPPPAASFSPFTAGFGGGAGNGGVPILKRASSKSSSSLSDKSSGIEQGFESDHPAAGGTIKKRPTVGGFGHTYETVTLNRTWDSGQNSHPGSREPSPFAGGNIRLGDGGTLLRRTASAERLLAAGPGSRNYEELQQLLDELHSNVRQAKDIQAKIKNSLGGGASDNEFPPPPPTASAIFPGFEGIPPAPPPRTSSRLSIDEESLPPPPPELQSPSALIGQLDGGNGCHSGGGASARCSSVNLGRQLPPIAPKPSLGRLASSPSMSSSSSSGGPPRYKVPTSYGTLPNPSKKKANSGGHKGHQPSELKLHKSGRRISFDDNIQMIDNEDAATAAGHLHHRQQRHHSSQLPAGFLQGLEKEWLEWRPRGPVLEYM